MSTISANRNASRFIPVALVVALLWAAPVTGQTSTTPSALTLNAMPVVWQSNLITQVQEGLFDPSDEVRVATMQVLLDLHKRYPDQDWEAVVPHLIANYKWMKASSHRMLALAGLNAIGGDEVVTQLTEAVAHVRSETVRRATFASLGYHRQQARQ